jgi:hypothetical protein
VRQIVKLSGGRLGVQSRLGQGSMFWVELRELVQLAISYVLMHIIALGVGSKALVPSGPPTLIPNESSPDLNNIQSTDDRAALNEGTGNSVTMAVDAATLRWSQLSPAPTRSSSALHSLMEQGKPLPCYF